ncbi:MAG: hypothetical protein WBK77_00810 [Alphaproteobacteria bacterium]
MFKKHSLLVGLLAVVGILGNAGIASAEGFQPALHGLVLFELENDWNFDSDDEDSEINNTYLNVEPYIVLSLTDKLAIESTLVFEQVQDLDPGEDGFFDNEGLYVEQLMLSYTDEHFSVFAGKYGPTFGTAWDLTPGVYGVDFAEDYELAEKIGGGASCTFGNDATGEHTITGNVFFADTTFLSDSTITRRGDLDESDGGISNTEDLSSFSLTLDSENVFAVEGLNTHLGYRNQDEGDADVGLDNESGYVAGVNYTFPLSDRVEAMVLAEWAGIYDVDGASDDTNYLTLGGSVTIDGHWNVAASYTARNTDVAGGGDVDDYLAQTSVGYQFDNGIAFDVGYSNREEASVETSTVGALLSYTYEF